LTVKYFILNNFFIKYFTIKNIFQKINIKIFFYKISYPKCKWDEYLLLTCSSYTPANGKIYWVDAAEP
jgi:hypothetical protein